MHTCYRITPNGNIGRSEWATEDEVENWLGVCREQNRTHALVVDGRVIHRGSLTDEEVDLINNENEDNPSPFEIELYPLVSSFIDGKDRYGNTVWKNPGRNDKCPCGSGKKYKKCHLTIRDNLSSLSDMIHLQSKWDTKCEDKKNFIPEKVEKREPINLSFGRRSPAVPSFLAASIALGAMAMDHRRR